MCVCMCMYIYIHNVWILDLNHISTRSLPFPGHLTVVCPRTSSKRFRRRSPWPSIPGIPPAKPCFGKKGKPPSPRTAPRKTVSRSFFRGGVSVFMWKKDGGKHVRATLWTWIIIYNYIYMDDMETGQFCGEILWATRASSLDSKWPARRSWDPGWESRKRCGFENGGFSWENDDSPVDGMGVPKIFRPKNDMARLWIRCRDAQMSLHLIMFVALWAMCNEKRKMGEWYGIIVFFLGGMFPNIYDMSYFLISSLEIRWWSKLYSTSI